MTNPPIPSRAVRVIRLHALPAFLGVQRSQVAELVKQGKLHPFSITGKRALVVSEDEVVALQTAAMAKAAARRSGADAQ